MFTAIRLTVLTGPHRNRRFCFCGPTRCQVGRALDCFIQLSGSERDQLISRHHCQLEIDPPAVRVEDLGSSNGTYINGKKVDSSPRQTMVDPNSMPADSFMNHGDVLTIGGTTLRIDVVDCPHAGSEVAGKSIWESGETARRDCPLSC
jgi:eukaryotic-like serine/threonine-protein kinase